MLAAGRVTQEDAARLRAAAELGGLDEALDEIRVGHARARIAQDVSRGVLTSEEAEVLIERLDKGEDPRSVLRLRRTSRPRSVVVDHASETDRSPDG